jgi:hypothetical protein
MDSLIVDIGVEMTGRLSRIAHIIEACIRRKENEHGWLEAIRVEIGSEMAGILQHSLAEME